jgi:hypothetical protein
LPYFHNWSLWMIWWKYKKYLILDFNFIRWEYRMWSKCIQSLSKWWFNLLTSSLSIIVMSQWASASSKGHANSSTQMYCYLIGTDMKKTTNRNLTLQVWEKNKCIPQWLIWDYISTKVSSHKLCWRRKALEKMLI